MAEPTSTTPWGPDSDPYSKESMAIGPVLVRLPADAALSRVLRLAAGGIAAMAGFTVDEIEDIKIAVSEALLALIEHGSGEAIEMELSVAMESRPPGASRQTASGFNLRARTPIEDFDIDHPDLMLCRTVLAGVCSQHSIELVGGYAEIHAEIRTAEPNTTSP
ncbi:MAG TPA: hypothetical protein VLD86_05765 [Ilumatobacteraceae bacterium]|nr:hypothetical protein [Ilumatobacteraceae bacterium]